MKKAALSLLLVLLLASSSYAHWMDGRWCTSSWCDMCNRLHLMAGHDQPSSKVYRLYHSRLVSLHRQEHKPPPPLIIDSTPQAVVDAMLRIADPAKTDILCDLGCGDGRIVITAARKYGCRTVGVEIKKDVAALAQRNVKKAKLDHLVTIIHGDARKFNLAGVDIVTMYLLPGLMEELLPEFSKAKTVLSVCHQIPDTKTLRVRVAEEHFVYVWSRPSRRPIPVPRT